MIPADTYGAHPDIATMDVGTVLIARDDFDSDLGFGIARAIWHERNTVLFESGHPRGKLMDKKLAARSLGVPIQDGAARYYISKKLMEPPPRIAAAEPSRPLAPQPAPRPAAPKPLPAPLTLPPALPATVSATSTGATQR